MDDVDYHSTGGSDSSDDVDPPLNGRGPEDPWELEAKPGRNEPKRVSLSLYHQPSPSRDNVLTGAQAASGEGCRD